jgi:uncharacterized protein (TIGR03437 family)
MGDKRILFTAALASILTAAMPLAGATFGNVVTTVGGHPADIALDESRAQLYIANFTALEIDVMSTKDNAIHSSIPLPSHPSGVALSPDSTYLVATEYQNGTSTPQGFNGVTIINLTTNAKQNFSTGDPALGVSFLRTGQARGATSGQALVVTTTGFYLLDPVTGYMQFLVTFGTLAAQAVPVTSATFPGNVVQTQLTSSADGLWVWGVADAGTGTQLLFRYSAVAGRFIAQVWTTSPALLPRVTVASDGSSALISWAQFAPSLCGDGFTLQSRYPKVVASTSVTGHALFGNTIYAQIFDANQPSGPPYYPTSPAASASSTKLPALSIMDADNMTVRDRIALPENLVGRGLVDSAGNYMYAISDSGVTVLPVGLLNKYPRIQTSQSDVLVQTNFCNRNPLTATFQITDPGGNSTDFQVLSNQPGVVVSPSSGRTPATVTVSVQPGAIPNTGGTLAVSLTIYSNSAVNLPAPVRLLISNPDTDQRGTIVDIPGTLVDLLSDVGRNRFYVIRQDQNQVLVFDGSNYQQLATLRTFTTPTGMSLTADNKYLVIASRDSQMLRVYDMDSFQEQYPLTLPGSHYGVSVAQSNVAMLALVENDGGSDCAGGAACAVDRLDLFSRCAYSPQTLGVFKNDNTAFPATSVLSPSPDQNSILAAAPNGNVMLYDATHDTFILSRKDLTTLSGAYAVSSGASAPGSSTAARYVIGNNIFDGSLVPQATLDPSVGNTTGFAFTGAGGYRVSASTASGAGIIQNVTNVMNPGTVRPVRTVEASILSSNAQPFTRTVGPLSNSIVVLTTSGVTVLSPSYDSAVTTPAIAAVTSAADGSQSVAPGGLVSIYGSQMSPTTMATSTVPLPTALAGSCLSVNGVPVPLLFVSSSQVNAQLPNNLGGGASLSIHTPGGVSNSFNFNVLSSAPTVFMSGNAGPVSGLATIVRADNNQLVTPTNPVHQKDTLVIYLTGMGATSPQVNAGFATPMSPLSTVNAMPTVTLGGTALQVQFAGLSPQLIGVNQINVYVPFGTPQGNSVPLVISQGGSSTTLNVRVVN